MFRNKRLVLLLFLGLAAIIYYGCDQPEDILTPLSKTDFYLLEERLPSNPSGMIYELWVADDNDTVAVGQFGYNSQLRKFYTGSMVLKTDSNKFSFEGVAKNYDHIFVSVEQAGSNNVSPGPIMLIGNPANPTIELIFPDTDSLWGSTVSFNMSTPSDSLDQSTHGQGLWFSYYTRTTRVVTDTLSINNWSIDSGTFVTDTIIDTNIIGIDSNTIDTVDTNLILGLDTVVHTFIRFSVLTQVDTADYYPTSLNISYNVTSYNFTYENFNQGEGNDDFGLPDYSSYGWKYKGWVVSPYIDASAVGRMSLPPWPILSPEFDETDGGLISTGTFAKINAADDDNPYSAGTRVPQFPGEDFFQNLPAPLSSVNFVPNVNGPNPGRVFLSLEPNNSVTDTTNFPLIPFIGEIPATRADVTDTLQQFVLNGKMFTNDPYRGFPKIVVKLVSY